MATFRHEPEGCSGGTQWACGSRILTQLAERSNDGDRGRQEAQERCRVQLIVPGDPPGHPSPRIGAFATGGNSRGTTRAVF